MDAFLFNLGVRMLTVPGDPPPPGGSGAFTSVLETLKPLARDAWNFGVGLLIIVAMLGGLYYALQGTGGMVFGGSRMTAVAIVGVVGIVLLVVMAFLLIPELGDLLTSMAPPPPF